MKKVCFVLAIWIMMMTVALSAERIPVLVIDSGSDFSHEFLRSNADATVEELNGYINVDDDENGYVDDIYGWNFVDDNATLVNLDHTPPEYDIVLKFLDIIGKLQSSGINSLSQDELAFARKYYNDKQFMAWVGFTGGWAHGTHVAGIVANNNENVALKAITHIPTGQAPLSVVSEMLEHVTYLLSSNSRSAADDNEVTYSGKSIEDNELYPQIVAYFKQMGADGVKETEKKAKYVGSLNPRVINCSFGTDNKRMLEMFEKQMKEWGYTDPTQQDVQDMVNLFVKHVSLASAEELFKHVPNALIVIAAGNSSENNDGITIAPNNISCSNKIVVAATNNDEKLADFSCYGSSTVDIAVPGVNILSSYPNGKMGKMSGTSQAAPLVSKYASMVLAANPSLTPQEVKKILMETVDKKSWLKDKVVSGGVANIKRAVTAAAKMIEWRIDIDLAITLMNRYIPDELAETTVTTKSRTFDPGFLSEEAEALYYSAIF